MALDLDAQKNPLAPGFCQAFIAAPPENRLIFGRNVYGESIAAKIEIAAYIDDFTTEKFFKGRPVIRTRDIPAEALVVSSLLGKPKSGSKRLDDVGANHLDYFSFFETCGLDLPELRFWGSFKREFAQNSERFEWAETLLSDDESRAVFSDILNFRLSGNLEYMKWYNDREKQQYFETFLDLRSEGEVFVDAGGYDGFTSLEFIRRCPGYEKIYFLEPDPQNIAKAIKNLESHANMQIIQAGLAAEKGSVRFSPGGSVAAINSEGEMLIDVERLDDMVTGHISFIKMDIEGSEKGALEGARSTIIKHHPKMAIAAYHLDDDFWRIPELIFSMRNDYRVYLRHYTEGVAETVMFFIPE